MTYTGLSTQSKYQKYSMDTDNGKVAKIIYTNSEQLQVN